MEKKLIKPNKYLTIIEDAATEYMLEKATDGDSAVKALLDLQECVLTGAEIATKIQIRDSQKKGRQ